MGRRSLDRTLDFIRSLDAADSQDDICRKVLELAGAYGAEHVLAGVVPMPGALPKTQRSNVLLDAWPEEWALRYFSRGYLFSDPAIALLPEGKPFQWSEIGGLLRLEAKGRLIMNEAADFGLKNGFTIPLFPIENEIIGFSVAGPHLEIPPQDQSMLLLMSSYAVGRSIALKDEREQGSVALTAKEAETLKWIAEGFNRHQIADRMHISAKGVDWHLSNIRYKLGARTTAYAVATAMRLGLVT